MFFFFQAEDGIRDYKVTGVQTCALPIYLRRVLLWCSLAGAAGVAIGYIAVAAVPLDTILLWEGSVGQRLKIGRASCREREDRAEGEGEVREQNEKHGSEGREREKQEART